jgi:hypothetical protein
MKKNIQKGRLRIYDLEDGSILLEVGGEFLIHIPPGVAVKSSPRGEGVVPSCDIQEGTTKKGRRILRLRPGDKYCVSWDWGAGSRSWDGWFTFPDHPEIMAWAGPTSKGGGCWWEVWIRPVRFGTKWRPDPKMIRAEILQEEIREEIGLEG